MGCGLQPGSDEWGCRSSLWFWDYRAVVGGLGVLKRAELHSSMCSAGEPCVVLQVFSPQPCVTRRANMATSQLIFTWLVAGLLLHVSWRQFHYHQGSGCVMMPDVTDLGVAEHNFKCVWMGETRESALQLRAEQSGGYKVTMCLCQDFFPPVAEIFCPLPKSHDVDNLALSLLSVWAHYPSLSVTGFVTVSSPIREARFCCFSHKLLFCTTSWNKKNYFTDNKESNHFLILIVKERVSSLNDVFLIITLTRSILLQNECYYL